MYRAQRVLRTMADGVDLGGKIALRHRSPIPRAEHYKKLKQTRLAEVFETCISVGWCSADRELDYLLESVLAGDLKWLEMDVDVCQITPKGYLELESKDSADSKNGFCAMWFDDLMLPFYVDVIEKAIRASGYEPVRLDHKEHNNNIDDEIIASIRGARFVIAEMTGHRGGVYFEAGFAHGLGLPVIYMLREDDQNDIHFDVRQQNFTLWSPDDLPDACKRLENRIRATLGQGPLNPGRH
jgi:nucleoside 2-deoxyribosyltransferase